MVGVTMCFNAAGADSLDDLTNPVIFGEGTFSVVTSMVGAGELNSAKHLLKITKATTNTQLAKTTIKSSIEIVNLNNADNIMKQYVKNKSEQISFITVEYMLGYDKDDYKT